MSDAPEFNSAPVDESPKPRKPRARKKPAPKASTQEINRAITTIYQDDSGHMPNMKKIQVRRHGSVAGFFVSLIVIGAIVSAGAWAKFFFWPSNANSDNKIDFSVTGPESVAIGATSTYTIMVRDNLATAIQSATLNIRYPAGFVFLESSLTASNANHNEWTLGEIGAGKKFVFTITGKNYGSASDQGSWRALLNYRPANVGSDFQKTAVLNTKFDASPFTISATGPDSASAGSEATYTYQIQNQGDWKPNRLELSLITPAGFTIVSSSPALVKNRWAIDLSGPSTTPLSEQKFSITGTFANNNGDTADLKAVLYLPVTELNQNVSVAENTLSTALAQSAISISLAANGSLKDFAAKPGDSLNLTLNLKNSGKTDIKKAIVRLSVAGPAIGKTTMLDWKNINDPADGNIEGKQISDTARSGNISWDSKNIPALSLIKAGAEVNIDLRLPIKSADGGALSDFKENKITMTPALDYTDSSNNDQTLGAAPIIVTVVSDLSLETRQSISGANGEKHDIKWMLANNFHALKNVSISADVYGDIAWTAQTASAGELKFDEAKKTISWTLSDMPESIDTVTIPYTITLNKKDPTQNLLVGKAHVTALDTVSNETIDFLIDGVSLK